MRVKGTPSQACQVSEQTHVTPGSACLGQQEGGKRARSSVVCVGGVLRINIKSKFPELTFQLAFSPQKCVTLYSLLESSNSTDVAVQVFCSPQASWPRGRAERKRTEPGHGSASFRSQVCSHHPGCRQVASRAQCRGQLQKVEPVLYSQAT